MINYFIRLCILSIILILSTGVELRAQDVLAEEPVVPDSNTAIANSTTSIKSPTDSNKTEVVAIKELRLQRRAEFLTPKKKAMFSAVLPGLGQVYNGDYWKLPIIYGGIGAAGYFFIYNSDKYNYYRKLYAGRISNDATARETDAHLSDDEVKYLQDSYRQDLDLTVLLTVVGYGLQVMDALVFAHLKGFDISDDISFRFKPVILPHNSMGIGLVMNF